MNNNLEALLGAMVSRVLSFAWVWDCLVSVMRSLFFLVRY
jgi:hypothetical protein